MVIVSKERFKNILKINNSKWYKCEDVEKLITSLQNDLKAEEFKFLAVCERLKELDEKNERLTKQINVLKVALGHYADEEEWYHKDENSPYFLQFNSSHSDSHGFKTAQEALDKVRELVGG